MTAKLVKKIVEMTDNGETPRYNTQLFEKARDIRINKGEKLPRDTFNDVLADFIEEFLKFHFKKFYEKFVSKTQ